MAISSENGSSNGLGEHSFTVGIEESRNPSETPVSETGPTHTCSSLHDKDTVPCALSSVGPGLNSEMPLLEPFSGQCAVTFDGDSLPANPTSTSSTATTQEQASASTCLSSGGGEEKAGVPEEPALHESTIEKMLLDMTANLSKQVEVLKRMVIERDDQAKEAELRRQTVEYELLIAQQQHTADVENRDATMENMAAEIQKLKIQIESYREHIARLQKQFHESKAIGLDKECKLLNLRSEATLWKKQAEEKEYQRLLAEAKLALKRKETALMKAELDAYKAELIQLKQKKEDES